MPDASSSFSGTTERRIVWWLCLLAAVHVFIFSAALPFFNNVDEDAHFDLVVKYSHARVTPDVSPTESVHFRALFHSYAYFNTPQDFPGGQIPQPIWKQPAGVGPKLLAARETIRQNGINQESSQPPLYYAVAGLWWKACGACGLSEGNWLYALRFLNVLFVVALVWLGYFTARMIFPGNPFLRLGVPSLLAFLPQSVFYSINNDVLSPLAFGAVFIGLVRLLDAGVPNRPFAAATGLAMATAFLVKMTNLPLLIVAFTVITLKARRLAAEKNLRPALPALGSLIFCAVIPMAAWMAACKNRFGDFTGSRFKMQYFGWTYKPVGDWCHHPLFSPHGLWNYLQGQLSTFWQGELWWHGGPIGVPWLNIFYTLISLLLPAAACAALWTGRKRMISVERDALSLSAILTIAALGFFAFMSVIYDYGQCINPSRTFPFFHAGRMMLGAVIPFMLLFVFGVDRMLDRFAIRTKFAVLAAFIVFMLAGEVVTDWPFFSNEYNWFHL